MLGQARDIEGINEDSGSRMGQIKHCNEYNCDRPWLWRGMSDR